MTDQHRPAHHLPPLDLVPWSDAVAELYGLPERFTESDLGRVLDVARDVSKNVARPAAPVTTFLLGVALGQALAGGTGGHASGDTGESRTDASGELARLARQVQDAALAVPLGATGANGGATGANGGASGTNGGATGTDGGSEGR